MKLQGVSCKLEKRKQLIYEFLRYVLVGGFSFLVDAGVMALVKELFFKENCTSLQMALCVALGFVAGLAANYLLSSLFVFRTDEQKAQGRNPRAFFIYFLVGLIGFGLTELGMYIGIGIVGSTGLWYLLVKCFVAGVVLIWNYIGRKIFVYHGR
ncbi:MAG: GtrA family protein [Oscillospiraceae bacterium]|nr:GtrA family protein [Oscillospiraceae bacterium]